MDTATVSQIHQIMLIPSRVSMVLMLAVGIAGIVGAVMAGTTRADAFDAANRQSKGCLLYTSDAADEQCMV